MQFRLNAFQPGDPGISEPVTQSETLDRAGVQPDTVDVLIVGSGPAGFTLAAMLSRSRAALACPELEDSLFPQERKSIFSRCQDGFGPRSAIRIIWWPGLLRFSRHAQCRIVA